MKNDAMRDVGNVMDTGTPYPLRNYQDFENFLSSRTNYERLRVFRYGPQTLRLDRMLALAESIGNPHLCYATVHVAGTKGKGTTSLILEALLSAEGFLVGTYTSPHIEEIRERIRVGGEPVSKADLVRLMNVLLPALKRDGDASAFPTFFELMTALAMLHFARSKVDWAIFEVGLGGRLDATNILAPRWSAITSVGLEHTQILGNTLAEIAREKAGIIKPETPVVLGPLPQEAQRVVSDAARRRRAEVYQIYPDCIRVVGPGRLAIKGFPRPIRSAAIRGPALRADLAVAMRLHDAIMAASGRTSDKERLSSALGGLELPARVEVFDGDPPVVLDGAHTAESFQALRLALEEIRFPAPRLLLLSIAADKWLEPILQEAQKIAGDFVLTRADPVRSLPPEELKSRLGRGTAIEDPLEALEAALAPRLPVVVSGSIYLAGAVRARLRELVREPG